MAQLVVRNLDDEVKERLQQRASRSGRSMEEEVRDILRNAVADSDLPEDGLGSRIASRFAGLGFDQEILELKGQVAEPVNFVR
ncbi:MAG: FitA-like ribbon-helix-helix domain-containing protein [Geminicoccaceae bacterium]